MSKEANPEMLILARELRGISQTELMKSTGIQQASISRYEGKISPIPESELKRFAEALEFPIEFFYRAGSAYGAESGELFHRKRQSLTSSRRNRIYALLNILRLNMEILLDVVDVEYPYRIPNYDPKKFNGNIEDIAAAVRAAWNMPSGHVRNLIEVLEDAFCIILEYDFGTDQIDEIVQWIEPMPPIMLVNNQAPGDRIRFSIAHALGHLVMHHHIEPYPEMETEADQFAAAFLMPADDIRPDLDPVTIEHMLQLKPKWKVSIQSLIFRARDLGVITDRRFKSLFEMISRSKYRKNEPFSLPIEHPSLFKKLLNLYQAEFRYSTNEMAQLLKVGEHDFQQWYFPKTTHLRLIPKKPRDSGESVS